MSQKTYAEVQSEESFDWRIALKEATERELSDDEWEELGEKSNDWVSCACGNMCSIIPRDHVGRPKDEYLAGLGETFNDNIDDKDPEEALKTLCEIEKRSEYLILQIDKAAGKSSRNAS
jgi:hypothetical protein